MASTDEERSKAREQIQKLKDSITSVTLTLNDAKNAFSQRQAYEARRSELSEAMEKNKAEVQVR